MPRTIITFSGARFNELYIKWRDLGHIDTWRLAYIVGSAMRLETKNEQLAFEYFTR